jgi:carboxyl-terminal processing protease
MLSRKLTAVVLAGALCVSPIKTPAQHISSFDKSRVESMLSEIERDVRKKYYDPKMHGLDWDAEVRATKKKIDDSPSLNMAMSHLAALLDRLNDSHTFFLSPPRPYTLEFGYSESIIGDRCFIGRLRPGSDAEKKGVQIGDEVLGINGYTPLRENLWKMHYVYRGLRPQSSLALELKSPTGVDKKLVVNAKEVQYPRVETNMLDYLYEQIRHAETERAMQNKPLVDLGSGVAIYKYQSFEDSQDDVDRILKQLRPYKAVIIDLRGNGGGSVNTLKWLLAGFFENSIVFGDRVTREPKDRTQMITKPNGGRFVPAKLFVLVDSESASAAEIFARTIQLQKRGIILGDVSSGSVMEARRYQYTSGMDVVAFYGASITDADVIMPDGKSLEHVGVTPDVLVLPTAGDLTARRDPVIARAAELAGATITPEKAGSLYPDVWPKQ